MTPLRRQYLDVKRRYPHAIVFFRLGDFYETFDEDAEVVARELEITLTSRPMAKGQRVPLAGIPHHALDSYLGKLIAKGYKVAICEQMEAPGKGKKLVERQVVRVVTPGTVVEESLLDQRANNYLAAVVVEGEVAGVAHVDVSTGAFACTQLHAEGLAAELERLRPAELLLPQGQSPPEGAFSGTLTPLPAEAFAERAAAERLLRHFETASLEPLGLEGQTLAVRAAGAVLDYLEANQRAVLPHIARLAAYRPSAYMTLDAQTRRNLEIFRPLREDGGASLFSIIDFTRTPMGARLLRQWLGQPLLDISRVRRRQDCLQLFFDSAVRRAQVGSVLAKMPDLERILGRVAASAGSPRDLVALRRGLELVPQLRQAVDSDLGTAAGKRAVHEEMLGRCLACEEAVALVASAIADEPAGSFEEGGIIRPGFSEELDRFRTLTRDARQYLADLERRERERSGIRKLKVAYNKVFGYYIEVSKANLKLVPADYQRRQTLVGAERFTTAELQEREYEILHARERQQELERELFRQVCAQVAAHGKLILATAGAIAKIDVYCALAEAAARYAYVRPEVNDGDEIVVRDGRHPVVERTLPEGSFVPNDLYLSNGEAQIVVLTGPNMAGKSTYLRQVALIVLLAQMGSFVPAAEARIGAVDRIFTRVGALDDIAAGRSTFMVEMVETAGILHDATPRSLLLFDEIGRGASTYDGMAIARAVVEFIHNRPELAAKTLFATHYHELVDLAAFLPRVRNYNVVVAEEGGSVVFLHRILPGGADRSYGVHVAQLAGLPRPVVMRAQEVLEELEASRDRHGAARPKRRGEAPLAGQAVQLPLLSPAAELARDLATLDVEGMTPLQALTKLYELAERARQGQG
ncbi:MAG: DNA mismatch repair protein MutS [Chloroflexi bacterium]|nr:DNA mismatch repair protein MutS [Chloroflexota bacterium]